MLKFSEHWICFYYHSISDVFWIGYRASLLIPDRLLDWILSVSPFNEAAFKNLRAIQVKLFYSRILCLLPSSVKIYPTSNFRCSDYSLFKNTNSRKKVALCYTDAQKDRTSALKFKEKHLSLKETYF